MALCAKCGQQTEGAARLCLRCANSADADPADRAGTVRGATATADYLRPFAPQGTQPVALRPGDDSVFWPAEPPLAGLPDPAGARYRQAAYRAGLPDAVRHEAPRTVPPDSAASHDPLAGIAGAGWPRPGQVRLPRRVSRWLVAAVIMFLACTAGAVALLSQHARPAPAAGTAARKPAGQPSPPTTASAANGSLLSVSPAAAAQPHATAVKRFLIRYFRAINDHDYAAYRLLFSTSLRGGLSAAAFSAGYGSSRDSQETLRSISSVPAKGSAHGAEIEAVVTFVSHQTPDSSPTHSACTAWTIAIYLVRHGRTDEIVSPPAGYQAAFSGC